MKLQIKGFFLLYFKTNKFSWNSKFGMIYDSLLHLAVESKNIELIKYLISFRKNDIRHENIFFSKFFYEVFNNNNNLCCFS